MAKNRVLINGRHLSVAATAPATPASGDPVIVNDLPGVALTAERSDGTVTIDTEGAFDLAVSAVSGTAGSTSTAIPFGGRLYYFDAGSAVSKLNRQSTGIPFGFALGSFNAGSGGTIPVKVWAS